MNTCTQPIQLHIVFGENPFCLRYHRNDINNTILSLFEEGRQWNLSHKKYKVFPLVNPIQNEYHSTLFFFLLLSKLIITDIGLRQLTQSKQINQHCGFDYL